MRSVAGWPCDVAAHCCVCVEASLFTLSHLNSLLFFLFSFNGIAGLAYDIIALPIGSFLPTVFEALIAGGDLDEPILHVYLSSTNDTHNSLFNFGRIDESVVAGPWVTHPMALVQPLFGYWMTVRVLVCERTNPLSAERV